MTEQGFSELAGKKVSSLLLILSLSKHYTTPLPQIYPPPIQNPTPISLRESLKVLENPSSFALKPQFARIRGITQSLIARDSRGIFKEKSKRDREKGVDREPLPHLNQRVFKLSMTFLLLDSYKGVECSNEGDLSKRYGERRIKNGASNAV